MRDKSYRAFPLGQDAAGFLRAKRKRLTPDSYETYELCLDKLARYFCDLTLGDLEPPLGGERLEEFMEHQWGGCQPRTYNKNHSILGEFFVHQVRHGRMVGNPMLLVGRAKARAVYRTTFTRADRQALMTANTDRSDRIALRLLLDYGLRKGALAAVQFKHFDHERRRLTVFTKGGVVRPLPLPQPAFWLELERLIFERQAEPHHYLLCRHRRIPHKGGRMDDYTYPEQALGTQGLHQWWYRRLERAGIVEPGVSAGERMHKARHTAGQRLLDATGNLKAVQKLLMHQHISTTGDIYTDWDEDQLADSLLAALDDEDYGS